MEETDCSETSAYKTQTPGNHPKITIYCDCLSVSVVGRGKKTKFKNKNQTLNNMGAQFYGPHSFILEEMF
jgi:hypothetical protein